MLSVIGMNRIIPVTYTSVCPFGTNTYFIFLLEVVNVILAVIQTNAFDLYSMEGEPIVLFHQN